MPKDQLYLLAPSRPQPKRFGAAEFPDHVRHVLRAWWFWLGIAAALQWVGRWHTAIAAGALAFFQYHTSAQTHPAVYPLEAGLDVDTNEFQNTIEGVTGMPFISGNSVQIYNNGDEFYPAMLHAIESAERSITMEQYIYWDGEVGRRFAEAFAEKARRGVEVKLLLDAIGSATLGKEIFRILAAGGCQLAWFRPIHWYTLHRANRRDHRKSLIIDGRMAFTGGAGLADHWLGSASNAKEWRDIQVAVTGPAALAQQSGFALNWLETTGEILSGERYFPEPRSEQGERGGVKVQTIQSSPALGLGAVGTMYLAALQCAKRELLIANPYFIPDARVIEMLAAARRRGVVVKLMLSGEHIDSWWARQNSIRLYGRLLEAGAEIYEFRPTMLHQKAMLVDGVWATIGTANFDNRSFALNEETNLCFHYRAIADELRVIFTADLARCDRVDFEQWRKRGLWQRTMEQCASVLEDQL
ncbi:MAG: phospholipase D-like domain-containing protein [Acidobacteriota bacterium]